MGVPRLWSPLDGIGGQGGADARAVHPLWTVAQGGAGLTTKRWLPADTVTSSEPRRFKPNPPHPRLGSCSVHLTFRQWDMVMDALDAQPGMVALAKEVRKQVLA